jgi:hypothetical protein
MMWVMLGIGCALSDVVVDPAAGRNGGFELVRDGRPVNWQVYDPDGAEVTVVMDHEQRTEGDVSLRLDVTSATGEPGWRSPGVAQEWPVEPGTWEITVDIRRERGAVWQLTTGSIDASSGTSQVVDGARYPEGAWATVSQRVEVPPEHDRVRVELIALTPGVVWVDDVRMTPAPRG